MRFKYSYTPKNLTLKYTFAQKPSYYYIYLAGYFKLYLSTVLNEDWKLCFMGKKKISNKLFEDFFFPKTETSECWSSAMFCMLDSWECFALIFFALHAFLR